MKLSFTLLVIASFQISARGLSQSASLELGFQKGTLMDLIEAIEAQSEYRIFYKTDQVDIHKAIKLPSREGTVGNLLASALEGSDISYRVMDNVIVLTNLALESQQQRVTGTVTDGATGEPLAGVTIQVKGTQTGGVSSANGTYGVLIPTGSTTLIFSFVGYQTQEIDISGRTIIDVIMAEEVLALEEVVVTGYSTERKKDILGSVSVVSTDEMLSTPSGNVGTQLQGRVAGVTISTSGEPGGASKVRVRGFGSFSGSDPLYIIDGVPGSIDRLNSNDIQSVQVLKDAASASVYGARASSGVVIVTTKQGKAGATKVNLDSYYGINYVSENDFPDLLNTKEYGEMWWKAMEGAGRKVGDANWDHPQYGNGAEPVIPEYILVTDKGTAIGGAALERLRISNPTLFNFYTDPANYDLATHQIVKSGDTDWFDEVFDPASIQNTNMTISGGSEQGTFIVGLNYFDEKSTSSRYAAFTRYSVRANSTFTIKDIIRVGENLQVSLQDRKGGNNGAGNAYTLHSIIPQYDIAGGPTGTMAPGCEGAGGSSTIAADWRSRFNGSKTWGIFGNVFVEINPIKDLTFRSSYGIDYFNATGKTFSQRTYESYQNTTVNSMTWAWNWGNSWTWTNTATYSKTLGKNTFKAVIGTEAINEYRQNMSASRQNFAFQDDEYFQILNTGTTNQTNEGAFSKNTLFSQFGRLDYTYSDKYMFNATLRRDGSSKFGKNNRWGYFPAFAAGWRVSSENFMKNLSWLTDLKLRASYGIIGNQTGLNAENQYTTFSSTDAESYPLAGLNNAYTMSYTANRLGNPDARWEKAITTNIGLDLSLLSGKIMFTGDYFIKEIEDLLVTNQAPTTGPAVANPGPGGMSGVYQPSVNVGNMINKGLDFTVSNRGKIVGDLEYAVNINFSTYKNEVTKVLDNPKATLTGGSTRMGNVTLTKSGQPISMFYGYKIEGFFSTQEEVDAYAADGYTNTWLPAAVGRWKIVDANGDKIINDNDRTYIGSPHPDFQMGFDLSLNYKNIDFNAFLFWNQGGDIANTERYNVDFNTFNLQRSHRMLYDSWTPDNTDAALPKLDINDTYSNKYVTSYYVEDASYLRLKNLQLGYTIPQSLVNKVGIQNLRIYAQAQNLLTFTRFSGMDPGVSISGNDLSMGVGGGSSPVPKQLIFGLNLAF